MNIKDQIFIGNAGLAILHPYLPKYFDMLGLLEENKQFKNEDSQHRAVHLIQYLATGQQETEEHYLVFNKILCGLAIETPISLSIEMSELEIEIAGQLLNAVLQNWAPVKSSTIENLRGSFLIRDGKLEEKGDCWELTVEQEAFDILLDQLPWNISMAKLPWMEKRVQCIWR